MCGKVMRMHVLNAGFEYAGIASIIGLHSGSPTPTSIVACCVTAHFFEVLWSREVGGGVAKLIISRRDNKQQLLSPTHVE
jgi:hypothetical protein